MTKSNRKLAQASYSPKGRLGEVPLVTPGGSFYNLHPKFSLIHVHSKYCLSACSVAEKAAIITLLHDLSKITWGQIWQTRKQGFGAEPLPDKHYKKMPQELKDKSNKYIIFRFSPVGRLIGFHEHDTLHVVWLDRRHEVCPTN
jgi:hypothetical protein